MDLQTAVCILAAATCVVSFLTIALCYGVNQLSVKNLNAAEASRQTALANAVVAEKLVNHIEQGQQHVQSNQASLS